MLKGKKILLCVSGGIAVFKAAALTSKLTQAGAIVKVIMTESARKFVTPLTFQALSRHDVYTDTFDEKDSSVIAHIDLADWADLTLIAPATANVIGKLANGLADDMMSTTLLAVTSPIFIAPAMNVHMYENPAVQKNIKTLEQFGYHFIEPNEGFLACGYVAKGRMEEPETIVAMLETFVSRDLPLQGKRILITAGPTRERIDPVRFMTNFSSGKMGYSIADEAVQSGAEVILISGPTNLQPPAGVRVVNVESAEDMLRAVLNEYDAVDAVIKTAAVADYRPKIVHKEKMKKKADDLTLELERTPDILKILGERKTKQTLVGFAAETNKVEEYAKGKLASKNLDMIVANNVLAEGAGFGTDTNIVTMYKRNGEIVSLPKLSKQQVATHILTELSNLLGEKV
ncbi:bifunctional phosphopantothenoylcysteine decarboxylase/phosphopantothenate--cysteine ligase CoaBC [Ectobacillus sp. sgz5001026]|uniref:bifunctional phosphopantothenoylcysteine decarboxylase/phosphopantothenate--cysteine ligase CoaBC n=1 Tax=Ectobacillus sp. sgz5001026 TaxID=3242473 RepID=UPI0036D279A0